MQFCRVKCYSQFWFLLEKYIDSQVSSPKYLLRRTSKHPLYVVLMSLSLMLKWFFILLLLLSFIWTSFSYCLCFCLSFEDVFTFFFFFQTLLTEIYSYKKWQFCSSGIKVVVCNRPIIVFMLKFIMHPEFFSKYIFSTGTIRF